MPYQRSVLGFFRPPTQKRVIRPKRARYMGKRSRAAVTIQRFARRRRAKNRI